MVFGDLSLRLPRGGCTRGALIRVHLCSSVIKLNRLARGKRLYNVNADEFYPRIHLREPDRAWPGFHYVQQVLTGVFGAVRRDFVIGSLTSAESTEVEKK